MTKIATCEQFDAHVSAMKERWRRTAEVVEAARSFCHAQHCEPPGGPREGFNPVTEPYRALQRAIGALEAHERQHGE